MGVVIHPAEDEPGEPSHRIKVAIQPLGNHDDEKSECRKSQRVATTGSEPVAAQHSPGYYDDIDKETEETEGRARVADIILLTGVRLSIEMGCQSDGAGAVPDRLQEG